MIEAVLLIGVLFLLPATGVGSLPLFLLFCVVLLLCLPMFRMALMKAPPFVPSGHATVREMLALAAIEPGERVYDLGCGEGRIVRAAARTGARATGYELSPSTYALAVLLSFRQAGAEIRYGNFWKRDYGDADVIFCYLLIGTMKEFQERIWPRLKPGCRVVSHAFRMPGTAPVREGKNVYLYVKGA